MRRTVFNTALVFDRLSRVMPIWLYACGAALLAAKIVRPDELGPGTALIVALIFLCACVVADLVRHGGGWYDAAYATAWLDLHNRAGGEIMAGDEEALKRANIMPAVSLKPFLRCVAMPLLFLAAVYFVPMPERARAVSGVGVERAIAAMANRVKQAERSDAIPKPDAEALHERLRRLETVAKRDPAAAAEALAALSGRLEAAAADRLERGDAAQEKLRDALKAAEAVERGVGDADESEASASAALDAVGDIAKAEGGADNLDPALRDALADALADAPTGGGVQPHAASPSARDLGRLSDALRKAVEGQAEAAMACGLIDPESAGGNGDDGGDGTPSLSASMDSAYGRGGTDRGGGAAPPLFGGETEEAGARFEHSALPEGGKITPGRTLERRRIRPTEAMPPEEFRAAVPGGHAVPGRVRAGSGAAALSPARSRAAEEYFRRLANGDADTP